MAPHYLHSERERGIGGAGGLESPRGEGPSRLQRNPLPVGTHGRAPEPRKATAAPEPEYPSDLTTTPWKPATSPA